MIRLARRRAGIALVTAGVACVASAAVGGLAMTTAHADTAAPGSGFGALDLFARSSAIRLPAYSHQSEDVSFSVPYAESTLKAGGVGHAVTSVFWPGATGANGGTVLALVGAQCVPPNPNGLLPVPCATTLPEPPPAVYQALNDPEKAENTTSGSKDTVTLDRPYGTMTATSTESKVIAETTMAGGKSTPLPVTFGATEARSSDMLTGPKLAVIDAVSTVRDINLGGVITIGAVTSVAHATTDGTKATGTAHTTVSGMKIGGVPVTVDERGITVNGNNASAAAANAAVNQALAQSGFQIFFAKPRRDVKGSQATLDSGSLVITQNNDQYTGQGNDTGQMLQLGGASIVADANPGFPYVNLPVPPIGPAAGGNGAPATAAAAAAGGVPALTGDAGAAPVVAGGTANQAAPVLASNKLPLPAGVSALLVILALFGAGLVAAGLRRFTDQVLVAGGPACPLGEQ
jgi:hypothetical protein